MTQTVYRANRDSAVRSFAGINITNEDAYWGNGGDIEGDFYYSSTDSVVKYYNGSTWRTVAALEGLQAFTGAITIGTTLGVTGASTLADTAIGGSLNLAAATELTIATGIVTATKSFHTVDTEADGATDDLDTISGGVAGDVLVIMAADGARSVVAKDGVGNLKLAGDFTLDNEEDVLVLISNGTNWFEVSRSDNGA